MLAIIHMLEKQYHFLKRALYYNIALGSISFNMVLLLFYRLDFFYYSFLLVLVSFGLLLFQKRVEGSGMMTAEGIAIACLLYSLYMVDSQTTYVALGQNYQYRACTMIYQYKQYTLQYQRLYQVSFVSSNIRVTEIYQSYISFVHLAITILVATTSQPQLRSEYTIRISSTL